MSTVYDYQWHVVVETTDHSWIEREHCIFKTDLKWQESLTVKKCYINVLYMYNHLFMKMIKIITDIKNVSFSQCITYKYMYVTYKYKYMYVC